MKRSIALGLAVSLAAACSRHQVVEEEATARIGLAIHTATGEPAVATNGATSALDGFAWGAVDAVSIRVNGGAPVRAAGVQRWTAEIPLQLGDNVVEVTASGRGTPARGRVAIRRNGAVDYPSAIRPAPFGVFVGQTEEVTVAAAVGGVFDPESVRLVRLGPGGARAEVAALRDDGANGDDAAGDGVFSARVPFHETEPGAIDLVVTARGPTGGEDSAPFVLKSLVEPTPAQLADADAIGALAAAAFQQRFHEGLTAEGEREGAVAAVAGVLAADPRVAEARRQGSTIVVELASGFTTVVPFGPPGTLAGGAGPTSCTYERSISPFEWSFSPLSPVDAIQTKLDTNTTCAARFRTENLKSTADGTYSAIHLGLDVFEVEELPLFDIAFIYTHGDVLPLRPYFNTDFGAFTPVDSYGRVLLEVTYLPLEWCGRYGPSGPRPPCQGYPAVLDKEVKRLLADKQAIYFSNDETSHGETWRYQGIALLPYFYYQSQAYSGSLVYNASCNSFTYGQIAKAVLDKGARAYLGYTNFVTQLFATEQARRVFDCLLVPGATVSSCVAPEPRDPYSPLGAKLDGLGDMSMTICQDPAQSAGP